MPSAEQPKIPSAEQPKIPSAEQPKMPSAAPPANGFTDKVGSGKIAKLFMMLSVLPLPPIPVHFQINFDDVADTATKQALGVAMNSLKGQGRDPALTHSSHSIIAALTLFSDWCEFGVRNATACKLKKDGLVLDLMQRVLADGGEQDECSVDEDAAYSVFFAVTKHWVDAYLPPGARAVMAATKPGSVTHESDIHIGMAHYCYSQGVLYSAKGSALACPVHKTIQRSYEDKVHAAKADADAIENRELDSEEVRRQQQEMAELYSQHPFGKLLVLCFARIHRDTLKGHAPEGGSVTESARELLEKAQKVHAQVLAENGLKEVPEMQVVPAPPEEDLAVSVGTLQVEDPREDESSTERAVDMFVRLVAVCCAGSDAEADWNCLARNLEDAQQLLLVDDRATQSACRLVDYRALNAMLKPLVSGEGVASPAKKRVDEALLQIESGRGERRSANASDTMSFPSELGMLIRCASRDLAQERGKVEAKANALHAASEDAGVKAAAELFGVLGVQKTGRFEVLE